MVRLALVLVVALAAVVSSRQVSAEECATVSANGKPVSMADVDGVQKFWGSGDRVSDPFQLDEGLAIMHVAAMRPGDLIMAHLFGPDGEDYGLAVIGDGPYEGSDADDIDPAGEYRLSVKSSGPWTVTIEQP